MHVFFRDKVGLHRCLVNLDRELRMEHILCCYNAMKALVLIDYNTGSSVSISFSMTSIILPDSKHNVSNISCHTEIFYPKSARPSSHTEVTNVWLHYLLYQAGADRKSVV